MTRTRLLPRTHLCWFESMVALNAAKRQVVLKAFDQTNYDHEAASRLLGLHPNYLHRLIRALDLRSALKRAGR